MKKYIFVIIFLSLLVIECIKTLRLFDISGVCNISGDGWLSFFGSFTQTLITVTGFGITVFKLAKEKDEKEKPILTIKASKQEKSNYSCYNKEINYNQHRKVYIELINKGDILIKNPEIKNENNRIKNIYKTGTEEELEIIDPHNLQNNNKYIIEIELNYCEGMR